MTHLGICSLPHFWRLYSIINGHLDGNVFENEYCIEIMHRRSSVPFPFGSECSGIVRSAWPHLEFVNNSVKSWCQLEIGGDRMVDDTMNVSLV